MATTGTLFESAEEEHHERNFIPESFVKVYIWLEESHDTKWEAKD